MTGENKIRLHTFHNIIGFSTENTKQLYLTVEQAETLAKELKRFVSGIKKGLWYTTRVISDGIAFNESDNKKRPSVL